MHGNKHIFNYDIGWFAVRYITYNKRKKNQQIILINNKKLNSYFNYVFFFLKTILYLYNL